MQASELYEKVTNQIVADLEKGAVPWVKPWKNGNGGGIMPVNAATYRYYAGINVLILWCEREEKGYPTGEWMTFKQSCAKGGRVRKGEKGTHVIFVKPLIYNEGEDDERKIFMHKTFAVFNVCQIDGLPTEEDVPQLPPDEPSIFIAKTQADIRIGGDKACFIPKLDCINMPPVSAFKDIGSYYATAFHELGHWSGGEKRLNRELTTRFGTEAYAAEELVAELTSAFLCAEMGVQGELRHAGYVDHWIKLLKDDPKAIFTAASKASQAAHYLRSFSEQVQ
jgi:antirestriction protein ArdC